MVSSKLDEERLFFKYQLEKLKVNFEYETMKQEKNFKDKAMDVIKTLKIKQLDKLILIVSKLRGIQTRSKNNELMTMFDVANETGVLA